MVPRHRAGVLEPRKTSITRRCLQMSEDMKLPRLVHGNQAIYIDAVRRLAAHFRRSPDRLSEDLLGLRDRGVALGLVLACSDTVGTILTPW